METIVSDEKKRKKACDSLISHIEKDDNFDMEVWLDNDDCGTIRCIGGWMEYLVEKGEIEGFPHGEISDHSLLYFLTGRPGGGDYPDFGNLFFPEIEGEHRRIFTKEEALRTLKHFRETGIVNWDL